MTATQVTHKNLPRWEWINVLTPCVESKEGNARKLWKEARGPIPAGLVIRHKCDNGRCANLAHLELGTYRQNTADCILRGRGRQYLKRGER